MGRILISPRIIGDQFGKVVLEHANYFMDLNKLNKEEIVKDLNSGATGDEYAKLFNKHFENDLIIRMR